MATNKATSAEKFPMKDRWFSFTAKLLLWATLANSLTACDYNLFTGYYTPANVSENSSVLPVPGLFSIFSASGGDRSAQITWSASAGATQYRISYGTSNANYNSIAGQATASPFTITGLTNGVNYFVMVTAINASGNVNAIQSVSVTPVAPFVAPTTVTALSAIAGNSNVALSWVAPVGVFGALTYNILRGTSSGSETLLVGGVSGLVYNDAAAVADTPYFYKVQAVGSGGTSANSGEVTATPFGSASKLVFTTSPSAAVVAGATLATQPSVSIEDSGSLVVATSTATVLIQAYSDNICSHAYSSGTLTGSTATASGGVAGFSGVSFTVAGNLYLKATSGVLTSACSSVVVVSASAATQMAILGASTITTNSCAAVYGATIVDSHGNPTTLGVAKTVALTTSGSSAFYSDIACMSAIASVSVSAGQTSASFYVKNTVSETVTITGTTTVLTPLPASVTSQGGGSPVVLGQPDFTTNNNLRRGFASASSLFANSSNLYVWDGVVNNNMSSRISGFSSTVAANQPSATFSINAPSVDSVLINSSVTLNINSQQLSQDATHFFVADRANNKVQIYNSVPTANGATPALYLGTGTASTTSSTLNAPSGVASDGTNVVVADTSNNRVLIWTSFPASNSQVPNVILGQADFTHGSANAGNASPSATTLSGPSRVLIAGTKLLVSDSGNNRVLIWNTFPPASQQAADYVIGQPDMITATSGFTSQKMSAPGGLYFDGTHLYVVDKSNNRVLMYATMPGASNVAATYALGQTNLTNHGAGTTSSTLSNPIDISGTSSSNLFVNDQFNNRVLNWTSAITASGQAANFVIGQPSMTSTGAFSPGVVSALNVNGPNGVCTDGTALYVADTTNNRILVWNTIPGVSTTAANFVLGQPNLTSSGSNNASVSVGLSVPSRLQCKANYLMASDTNNHRVLIWTLPITANQQAPNIVLGQSVLTNNASGTTQNTLKLPSDVTFATGKIAVADNANHRILIWNSLPPTSGQNADFVLGQPDFITATANQAGAASLKSLNLPSGVFYDGTHLIVGDAGNDRLLIWNSWPTSNQQVADLAIAGYSGGIWSDGTKLYVTDCFNGGQSCKGNNRIAVWNTFPTTSNQNPDRVIGQSDTVTVTTQTLSSSTHSGYGAIFGDSTHLYTTDYWFHRVVIWNPLP